MKPAFLLLIIVPLLPACKKEEKTVHITYTITETSQDTPTYTVAYTSDNATKSVGNISASSWTSESVLRKPGDFISLNVSSQDASGDFQLTVYADGQVFLQDVAHNPNMNKTISGVLPQ